MSEVTPREHQKHHDEEPEKRHYVGKVTNAVLQMRFYQLMINWNPNLYGNKKEKYFNDLKENILDLQGKEILSSIMSKYSSHIEAEFNSAINKILAE